MPKHIINFEHLWRLFTYSEREIQKNLIIKWQKTQESDSVVTFLCQSKSGSPCPYVQYTYTISIQITIFFKRISIRCLKDYLSEANRQIQILRWMMSQFQIKCEKGYATLLPFNFWVVTYKFLSHYKLRWQQVISY